LNPGSQARLAAAAAPRLALPLSQARLAAAAAPRLALPLSQARLAAAAAPQLALPLQECAILDETAEERMEDLQSVGAAHGRLGRALGVRHEAEHGAFLVHDAGDVLHRAVGIRRPRDLAFGGRVAEHHLVVLAQRPERLRIRVVLA